MSFFIESLICFFKFFLTFEFIFHYGIIKGGIGVYLLFYSYRIIISRIFGLKPCGLDASFITNNKTEKYNVVLALLLEDYDQEKMKKFFIERGINKINRLRSVLEYRLFSWYWKEITEKKILEGMIEKAFVYKQIKNEEGLKQLVQDEVLESVEIMSQEKFPYEIHLVKFTESNKGAIMVKTDHLLSDGLGFVSLLCSLADNYSPELFPAVMRGKRKTVCIDILTVILFPINILKLILRIATNKPEKSPFKRIYDTKHNQHKGSTRIAYSNLYPIKKVENIKKKLKVSFNDIIVSIVLYSLKKKFPNINNMNFILPTGVTAVPNSTADLELFNQSGGSFLQLPLIENLDEDPSKISKILFSNMKNLAYINAASILLKLVIEYLPHKLLTYSNTISLEKVDLILSNVPGPTSPLYYAGSKVLDMLPIISTGRTKFFLPIYSYNKQFRFLVNYDESVGFDPKEMIDLIDEVLNDLEEKYKDSSN